MHVAHVVSSLEIGGQERVVLDLARGMQARGHRVTVISFATGGALRPRFEGIEVVDVPRRPGLDVRLVLSLARVLRGLAPDVVHTHNPAAMTYGGPAARLARVPRVVHTKHGANPVDGVTSLWALRLLVRLCDAVVAVSPPTAEVARARDLVPPSRLHVIPNGIDVAAYARDEASRVEARRALGIGERACLIGTVGRLAREKRHDLLVDAVAHRLGPTAALLVVGDGPERGAIEASIPPHARPFVHLVGARDDVPALLSAMDVFVLPSDTEGLPLVVPEAMAAGLPVVCTAVGGLPAIVRDGAFGRLVPRGDAVALGRAIDELARDAAKRRAWGQAALREAHARWDLERVLAEYERVYAGPASSRASDGSGGGSDASDRGRSRSGSAGQSPPSP